MSEIGKTIVSFVWAVVSIIIPMVSGDHHIDSVESVMIITAVGNNVIVYLVPAFPQFKSAKTVVTAVLAGAAVLQLAVASGGFGGMDLNDWYQVIAAALFTLGVWYAPATSRGAVNGPVRVSAGFNN